MQNNKQMLDKLMKDASYDLLPENELCILFEKLDIAERYADMFYLLTKYLRTITKHFENTSSVLNYNLEHKWNGDLKTLSNMTQRVNDQVRMTEQEWNEDLVALAKRTSGYKISKLINNKLKNKLI